MEAHWISREQVRELFKNRRLHKGNHAKLDGMVIVVSDGQIGVAPAKPVEVESQIVAQALAHLYKVQLLSFNTERDITAAFEELIGAMGADKKLARALVTVIRNTLVEREREESYSPGKERKAIERALDL